MVVQANVDIYQVVVIPRKNRVSYRDTQEKRHLANNDKHRPMSCMQANLKCILLCLIKCSGSLSLEADCPGLLIIIDP